MWWLGLILTGHLWLLDVWRQQASSDKWIESLCDLIKKWKPIGWAGTDPDHGRRWARFLSAG